MLRLWRLAAGIAEEDRMTVTRYIESETGTLVLSEHATKAFVCVVGGKSMFVSAEQLLEIEAVCRGMRRRICERATS